MEEQQTDEQKISPFYKTLSPIGAAALPPPTKTKEKVEQGKGMADHLMPFGYIFFLKFIMAKPTTLYNLFLRQNVWKSLNYLRYQYQAMPCSGLNSPHLPHNFLKQKIETMFSPSLSKN